MTAPPTSFNAPASNEILIMAMTRMRTGICTAGFSMEPHPESHLRWVRPVKRFGTLLLDDLSDSTGRIVEIGDVVQLALQQATPSAAHCEDWLTDFISRPPSILRQLTDDRRADFLAAHCDQNPTAVLRDHTRSLCLIQPEAIWANFRCDPASGDYEARMGFRLAGQAYPEVNPRRGMAVTDLKWRALGRQWLTENGTDELTLDHAALQQRLQTDQVYLSVGLSRTFAGKIWMLVIGVHPVPDYRAIINYDLP